MSDMADDDWSVETFDEFLRRTTPPTPQWFTGTYIQLGGSVFDPPEEEPPPPFLFDVEMDYERFMRDYEVVVGYSQKWVDVWDPKRREYKRVWCRVPCSYSLVRKDRSGKDEGSP